jgi:repressor LexA
MPVQSAAPLRNRILHYIADCIKIEGCPPTIREITEAFNIRSTSIAAYHLTKLQQAGYIERTPGKSRAIRIIRELPTLDDTEAVVVARKKPTLKPRRYNGYYERGAPVADVVVPLPYPVSMPRQQRRK